MTRDPDVNALRVHCTATAALAALLAFPVRAAASGCKTGTERYERAQFGLDLGLTVGGVGVLATERFGVVQVQSPQWVPAIDRDVPTQGSHRGETASNVLVGSAYAIALGWGVFETVRCRHEATLRLSHATPLLSLVWPWVWTLGFTELGKSFAGRPRPYTRGAKGFTGDDDNFRSIPSGHTSNAAVMATMTVASVLRFVPRLSRPLPRVAIAAAAGLTYGLTTGGMRVLAADHHWSDLLVGAAIGTSLGLLPIATERFGRKGDRSVAVSPWVAGVGGSVRARF